MHLFVVGTFRNVLEIGCGGGNLTRELVKLLQDVEIVATDYNKEVISIAKQKHSELNIGGNITYEDKNVEALPSEWKSKFDMVLVFDALHILPHPKLAFEEIYKVLSDKGVVVVVDPDIHSSHRANRGDLVAGLALGLSMFVCVPSGMSNGGTGFGVGWGIENKKQLLAECKLKIISEQKLMNDIFSHAMFCQKV